MSYTRLIINLWLARYIINITATTHQKAVLTVIQPFHAFYAPGTMKVGEAVNAYSLPLFDCHSSYTHIPMFLNVFGFNSFPFCKAPQGFVAGKAVFRAESHCGQEGE